VAEHRAAGACVRRARGGFHDGWHRFAAAAGGLLTYAWHSFTTRPFIGGGTVLTPVSHLVFALAALALLGFEARAIRRREIPVVERTPADAPAPVAGS
jgi:hypothetical protein